MTSNSIYIPYTYCITLTGELVSQFTTIKEGALSQSNIPFLTARTCISAVCRRHRDSFNGFIWKYD